MKILHTSDWHLGHSLYNYDRSEEQQCMLQQLQELVQQRQPDLFLLCGDVYHTPQPPAAVQTLFADAVAALHEACPQMVIVVTAGNHDSGSRHEIFRTPWRRLGVHMVGGMARNEAELENHLIEVPGKGVVIAVPYVSQRNLPPHFFNRLLQLAAQRNTEGLPIVLTAHTTVSGCDYTGHDHATEYTVGGIDTFDLAYMGQGYDYLALGHIHRPQFVQGSHRRARYSGTPLPITFDEAYPHSVSWVEIATQGAMPVVEEIEIGNPRPLVTLPTQGAACWAEAKELLKNFPPDIPAYIRLVVEVEDFLPAEANAEAAWLTADKQCHFCLIQTRRRQETEGAERKTFTVSEFRAEAPIDIARRYAEDLGISFDRELEELFRQTVQQVEAQERNE